MIAQEILSMVFKYHLVYVGPFLLIMMGLGLSDRIIDVIYSAIGRR